MTPPKMLRLLTAAVVLSATAATAQSASTDYRDEFLRQFEGSSRKITMLAEAMPQELYDWSPGEGVMSVGRVYMHIARYNFMYPEDALGVPGPSGLNLDTLEDIEDKAEINRILQQSVAHVREAVQRLSKADLEASTRLYGRDIAKWAVLLQLISHMNEHVGQSVAYARMNGIVPPWSR